MSHTFSRQVFRLLGPKPLRHRGKPSRARARRRPWALEGLEDRVLLASDVIMVENTALSDAEYGSLTYAVGSAHDDPNGVIIEFDPAVFNQSHPFSITLTSTLELGNTEGVEDIENPGGGSVTINGGDAVTVFKVDSGVNAKLSNLTISGGKALQSSEEGGGIDIESGALLTISGSTIENNSAAYGGGIYNAGTLVIDKNSNIFQNSAQFVGGGVYSISSSVEIDDSSVSVNKASGAGGAGIVNLNGTLKLARDRITHNTAANGAGGGVYNAQGQLTVTSSTFSSNSAASMGGGIEISAESGFSPSIKNSTISRNKAAGGAGIFVSGGALTIAGSTISGNTATGDGGGIAQFFATETIIDSTIADNSAASGGGIYGDYFTALMIYDSTIADNEATNGTGSGGGIETDLAYSSITTVALYNTILAMNTDSAGANADDIAGAPVSASSAYNLIGADETGADEIGSLADGTNGNQVGVVNPGLDVLSLANGGTTPTVALLAGSPAINAGASFLVPAGITTDERGSPRVLGPNVDIGAYESDFTTVVPEISFPPIPGQVYPSAPIDLSATDSLGRTVAFTVLSGPASVSGNVLTLTGGGGKVVIEASEAGNNTESPSPVIESFTVTSPTVYTVDLTSDTGASTSSTAGDLLFCITQANNINSVLGSVIVFDPSVFNTNSSSTITLSSFLELSERNGPERIDGPGANVVTISGNDQVAIFLLDSGVTATISGLTLSGGSSSFGGGGVYVRPGGSLTINDSTITHNSAYEGAGIYDAGTVTVNNSSLSDNTAAGLGGGIFVTSNASLSVTDSTLSSNSAGYDGAGLFNFGKATVTQSNIDMNSAGDGGGIFSTGSSASMSIASTTISNNNASFGGGIFVGSGELTITSSTLSGNVGTYDGGAVYNNAGTPTVINSTIANNSASSGAGIYNDAGTLTTFDTTIAYNSVSGGAGTGGGIFDASVTTTLYNTIVALNTDGTGVGATPDDIAGAAVTASSASNLIGTDLTGSLLNGSNGNEVGVAEPGLDVLSSANGGTTQTIALLPGSLAINAGDNALVPIGVTTDQRGSQRIVGPSVDIGAFESDSLTRSQQISFTPIADQVYPAAPITLTAVDSAGLTVSFTVISGPATVSGDILTLTGGTGTVVVEASQAGNTTYAAAVPVDVSFMVSSDTNYTVNAMTDTGAGSGDIGDLLYCITQANNNVNPLGSVIEFDPSVFLPSQSYTIILTSTLNLSETAGPEIIDGPGASVITISGGSVVSVFQIDGGVTATLSGLTISGGAATGSGDGGGITVLDGGTLAVTGSMIVNNSSDDYGGGIYNGGTLSVTSSTVAANSAHIEGGGIFNTGSLQVMDSTLSANFGEFTGGAIANLSGLTVTNSTVAGNSSDYNGGGIFNATFTATIVNSTIAYNEVLYSPGGGGGVYSYFPLSLDNTIVDLNTDGSGAGATADDIAGSAVSSSSSYNLVGADLTGSLAGGTGNQVGVTNPGLGTLSGNAGGPTETIVLLPGSPAIGAGSIALAVDPEGNPLLDDQRGPGFPRTYNGSVDIGAFEFNPDQQTINFAPIVNQVFSGNPIELTLIATASSGLPVSLTVVSGPATVSGDVLTITGAGTVDVEASQAGNATEGPAISVDQTFSVSLPTVNVAVTSSVNPSVNGEDVTFTANVTANGTAAIPPGYVFFYVNYSFEGYSYETSGTVTSPTFVLATGTSTIEAVFEGTSSDFSGFSTGYLSGGQVVNAVTAQNLQEVLLDTSTPDISAATNADLQTIIAAINGLSAQAQSVTITVNLGSGTFDDSTFSPPAGVTVVVVGNGTTTTFVGQSPAINVTQGNVIISDVTFTTATDAPTILVSGGSLTLRDDVIQESTSFTDAAISLTGGDLDLGTAADLGGNVLDVNGSGEFVHNSTGNSVPAAGDTFEVNGAVISEPYLSFATLSTSSSSSVFGQAVTLKATIQANTPSTGLLSGSVDFVDTNTKTDLGSVAVVNGTASLMTSALGAGDHLVRAFYSGGGNFTMSLDSLTEDISKAHLTVTTVLTTTDIGHGATVPTPTVSFGGFKNGDNSGVVSGPASFTGLPTTFSPAGVYTVSPITTGLSAANYDFPNVVSAALNVHPVVTNVFVEWGSQSISIMNLNRDLPFSSITAFVVTYSDPVNIAGTGLSLTSTAGGPKYGPAKVGSGQGTTAETWNLPSAIGIDRLMLAIDQSNTVAASATSLKLFGPATLALSVLPGDFNGDGVVSSADMTDVNNATVGAYDVWADLLGTGTINANDVKLARSKIGTSLPPI
jgi:hypothetical protein